MASKWNAVEFHGIQKIAIVSMVSMLFPWHFSGILWHPGRMLCNVMEFHGIQKSAIVSMVSMLFPWHFCAILWHPGGMLWNAMEFHGIPKDRIILTVEIHGIWDSDKISEWKAMDIGTLLTIGCRIHWNAMKERT